MRHIAKHKAKYLILIMMLLVLLYGNIAAHAEDINVSAEVKIKQLQIKVYPEKRVPAINNWATIIDLELRDCSTNQILYKFNQINTNNQGIATIDLSNLDVAGGRYSFSVRGASHLRKKFNCYNLTSQTPFVDLTQQVSPLLAGEISNKFDNYINSLDMSVLVKDLYTSDYYSDLNQDGEVNSLDSSIQLINLYKNGDN